MADKSWDDQYISKTDAIKLAIISIVPFANADNINGIQNSFEKTIGDFPSEDVQPVVRKPVEGYEGLYWVTQTGEVTNADGKVMKQYVKKGHATYYKKVALYKDGEYKQLYVHRIVAKAFIPNPNNYPQVNHIDEDGTNNNAYNLEWCTHKYNVNYGTAKERRKEKIVGVPHTKEHNKKISDSLYKHYGDGFVGKQVICLETGKVYDSVAKASRELNVPEGTICRSCRHQFKKGRRYTFRYYDGARMDGTSNAQVIPSKDGGT